MNENEILDKVFEIFLGTDSKDTIDGKFNIEDYMENLVEEDSKYFYGYKPIPEFYERIDTLVNKKELLMSALESESEERIEIGNVFVMMSPLSFFSSEEIDEILNSDKLKELQLDNNSVITSLIYATGHPAEYLTKENIEKYGLSHYDIYQLAIVSENVKDILTPEIKDILHVSNFIIEIEVFLKRNNLKDLTPQIIKEFGLGVGSINEILKHNGKQLCNVFSDEELLACGFDEDGLARIIESSGNIKKYLTPRIISNLKGKDLAELIKKTGTPIEDYFSPEIIKKNIFSDKQLDDIIRGSLLGQKKVNVLLNLVTARGSQIGEYLTLENIKKYELRKEEIIELIKATGKIEDYLTQEKVKEYGLQGNDITELIKATGKIEDYLKQEKIDEYSLKRENVAELIKATGKIEDYLKQEKIDKYGWRSDIIVELIEEIGIPIEDYFAPEIIKKNIFSDEQLESIIRDGLQGQTKVNILLNLITARQGKIEEYLTQENIKKYGLQKEDMVQLIKATGKIEEYITQENIKKYNFQGENVAELIRTSGNIEKYLKNIEQIQLYGLTASNILYIIESGELFQKEIYSFVNDEIQNGTYTYERLQRFLSIASELSETNSGRLERIINPITKTIMTTPLDKQHKVATQIKRIYETTDIPLFAQNFLVFKQLHPNFMGEENQVIYSDESFGNIPSLNVLAPEQRGKIIFSDLAKISVESNSRDLEKYLNTIEQGDRLFEMFKSGKLQLDDTLPDDNKVTLKKYSNMLNTLYNQTSKGKKILEPRMNSGNLEQDLTELNTLLNADENIHIPLRDRIVRTFGYWAGIRNFEQAKKMLEETIKQADKTNRKIAEKGDFFIKKGYLAKGILDTQYFPKMLQNGIVAKDYLGESASHDCTPLDLDVELIQNDEEMFGFILY